LTQTRRSKFAVVPLLIKLNELVEAVRLTRIVWDAAVVVSLPVGATAQAAIEFAGKPVTKVSD